jgi:hypothetical protein
MAASTAPTKPIRFNVQPPFLTQPRNLPVFHSASGSSTSYHLPRKANPGRLGPILTKTRRNCQAATFRDHATAAMLAPTSFPVNSGPASFASPLSRAEFAQRGRTGKTRPSVLPRTPVPFRGSLRDFMARVSLAAWERGPQPKSSQPAPCTHTRSRLFPFCGRGTSETPRGELLQKLQKLFYANPRLAEDSPQRALSDLLVIRNGQTSVGRVPVPEDDVASRAMILFVA